MVSVINTTIIIITITMKQIIRTTTIMIQKSNPRPTPNKLMHVNFPQLVFTEQPLEVARSGLRVLLSSQVQSEVLAATRRSRVEGTLSKST
jgi:hypothetical protein